MLSPLFKYTFRISLVYVAVLICYFLFLAAAVSFPSIAIVERKLNSATFSFWYDGAFWDNPPVFTAIMDDPENQFSNDGLKDWQGVDIWVLLLNGPEDIRNAEIAPALGVDVESIASSEPGLMTVSANASILWRWHPIPFNGARRRVVIIDIKRLGETRKAECFDEIIYSMMIARPISDLMENCRAAD
ncbi:MAG: hypothetical protein AAFQ64_06520 [Pseudomonadota bacterium]